ncbi:hypothetical protein BT93_D1395 [Corymbia citriodora subsp. variegata]|nr:hypothetical protein BT93_D1395 [Corymbia citriodora subsp. variegata]
MNITRLAEENAHKLNMPIIRDIHLQIKAKKQNTRLHTGAIRNKAYTQNQNKRQHE